MGRIQIPLRSCFLGRLCVHIFLKFLSTRGLLLYLAVCAAGISISISRDTTLTWWLSFVCLDSYTNLTFSLHFSDMDFLEPGNRVLIGSPLLTNFAEVLEGFINLNLALVTWMLSMAPTHFSNCVFGISFNNFGSYQMPLFMFLLSPLLDLLTSLGL